jgi:hypothetical protein
MKQKDVATSAAKHTAKVFLASADAGITPVIVASVLMLPTPSNVVSSSYIFVQALFAWPDFNTASMNAMTRVPVAASGANREAAFGERFSSRAVTRSAKSV